MHNVAQYNNIESTTVYFFRTGEKTTSYNPTNPSDLNPNNRWITDPNAPLSEKGKEQAKELGLWIKDLKFDLVISSEATASQQTASCALPDRQIDHIASEWREVELGKKLEGKNDAQVMALYAKCHPNKPLPFDGNECLKEPWQQRPGKKPIEFENYGEFKKRIISNLKALSEQHPGKTIAVFTHYEPLRDAILFSRGTDHFFSTEFGAAIGKRVNQKAIIESAIRRTMIKADKAAAIKLQIINDEFYVDDSFKIKLSEI